MAFTFSTEALQRPLADFGNDAAAMILQTGKQIEQGLQTMMTNRQVAGLGQELGTLNPESPEWAQSAVKLGARYPLAMKSPAGQFMLSTQAKAHAEWRQVQQATKQSDLVFGRQKQMEELRTQNDIKLEGIRHQNRLAAGGNEMMDLTIPPGMSSAPSSFGTDETQFQNAEDLPMWVQPRARTPLGTGVPLFGEGEDLAALSPGARVRQSLVDSGIAKIPVKEFRREVAAERRSDTSRAMQEDRQRQQEAMAEKARLASEASAEKRAETSDKKLDFTALKTELSGIERDIAAQRRSLNRVIEEQAKKGDLTETDHTQRTQLQAELAALGEERTRINNLLKGGSKSLSKEEAAALLKEAGGDKEKARALARERGFTL